MLVQYASWGPRGGAREMRRHRLFRMRRGLLHDGPKVSDIFFWGGGGGRSGHPGASNVLTHRSGGVPLKEVQIVIKVVLSKIWPHQGPHVNNHPNLEGSGRDQEAGIEEEDGLVHPRSVSVSSDNSYMACLPVLLHRGSYSTATHGPLLATGGRADAPRVTAWSWRPLLCFS